MKDFEKNLLARELESSDIEKAIELYEENVASSFEGNFPYDRLIIIYKKLRRFEDAIRVCKSAIAIYEVKEQVVYADGHTKLSKFQDTLCSLKDLASGKKTQPKVKLPARTKQETDVENKKDGNNIPSINYDVGDKMNILSLLGIKRKSEREFKGKSLLSLLDDYVVVDLETTGLMPSFDGIIEIGAVRYKDDIEIERFHSFVSVGFPLDPFIIQHTGITDAMLEGAPKIKEALPKLLEFIGDSIIVAHNANFDINFIYDDALNLLNVKFTNDFIDTMRLARKCGLPVENHKLITLAEYFEIPQDVAHRSTADCETTHALYVKLKEYIAKNNISLTPKYYDSSISKITATTTEINTDNPFYNKVIAFTGTLESMQRKDAAQLVANLGGILGDNVTKNTNFLVLGNFDYCSTIKDGKSSKHKRAEQLILKGQDLQIIPESVFLTMISEDQ